MTQPIVRLHAGRRTVALATAVLLASVGPVLAQGLPAEEIDQDTLKCLQLAGTIGENCLKKNVKVLQELVAPDPVNVALPGFQDKDRLKILTKCTNAQAEALGFRDRVDLLNQVDDGCTLFALDLNALVYSEDQVGLSEDQAKCRFKTYKQVAKIQKNVTKLWGKKCTLTDYKPGKTCDRVKRGEKIAKAESKLRASTEKFCGPDFDLLGTFEGGTLQARIATFAETAVTRGRHWAERIYPPNNAGPTAEFGPFNVGIMTLPLQDASRLNVPGTGPRPVTTEVYYPATDQAIVGVPRDVAQLFGLNLFAIPAYRDVDVAPGPHPLIVFSHGNEGIRIQSFFFAAQLASQGFIVVSADHHGNTFTDAVVDLNTLSNRPLDVSFLIDEFTAFNAEPGNPFENAIDLSKIGMSGHSLGGYTTFAVAGGPFAVGSFRDTRIKAIFPQAPATALFFDAAFFSTVTVPTLIVGGTIDETTPFDTDQQFAFDNLSAGPAVVGLAEIVNAGHFTFSSFCEVDPALLGFIGGFAEACEPRHLPWRHAQDLTMYLAHNFFDATLNGNAAALARLDPVIVGGFDAEDLVYQSK